jgi:hypothetical protein
VSSERRILALDFISCESAFSRIKKLPKTLKTQVFFIDRWNRTNYKWRLVGKGGIKTYFTH